MAWYALGTNLEMCEGDYGVTLPVEITGTEFTANDTIRITFKTAKNGRTILEKEATPQEGVIDLSFTAEESALFPIGAYVFCIDWYQDGQFMCNILPVASFRVVDKA